MKTFSGSKDGRSYLPATGIIVGIYIVLIYNAGMSSPVIIFIILKISHITARYCKIHQKMSAGMHICIHFSFLRISIKNEFGSLTRLPPHTPYITTTCFGDFCNLVSQVMYTLLNRYWENIIHMSPRHRILNAGGHMIQSVHMKSC